MPTREEAMALILDHYENPRNRGLPAVADVVVRGGNPGCGDIVTVSLGIDRAAGTIREIRFEGEGCTISQAAASLVTELLVGRTLADLQSMDVSDLRPYLGVDAIQARPRCAGLGLYTARVAALKYQRESLDEPVGSDAGPALGLEFQDV